MDAFLEANRANWDDRARLHRTDPTGSYRIAEVLAGGSSLHDIEAAELGGEVAGRDVVHLQCHIGLDTLSLAHLGARVTGLDFSPEALDAARDFAARAGTAARFVESDLYDAPAALGATYDIAFVTWGAINWLPDIGRWAKVVAEVLRPGGFLYLLEGHPSMNLLEHEAGRLYARYDWTTPREAPLAWDDAQTYTFDARPLTHTRCYEWFHPISTVVTALIEAGLALEVLREHERLAWKAFPHMVERDGMYELPEGAVRVPLAFSLRARKPR